MRKLVLSALTLVFAAALVTAGTIAFFSDTETSNNNSFTAGSLDLVVKNAAASETQGDAVVGNVNWGFDDVTNQLVYDFSELSPGDMNSVVTSLRADGNNAWMCAATKATASRENGLTEPEQESGDTTSGATGGELLDYMMFAFWADDGDGVYEPGSGEVATTPTSVAAVGTVSPATLVDSSVQYLTTSGPALADTAYSVGTVWCFGNLTENAGAFECDGTGSSVSDYNDAQTDTLEGSVEFFAVQSDNNPNFVCGDWTSTL